MRRDIMVDIETLGTTSNATIIQISAIAFDIETGEHLHEFNKIADIEKNEDTKVCGSTLKWWLNTDKELLTKLINSGEGSSTQLLKDFHHWLISIGGSKDLFLWGNGILFDNKIIKHQMEEVGLDYPIFFRNDRDVRTIVELASQKLNISEKELKGKFENEKYHAHDAIDDVMYQIDLVRGCYDIIMRKVIEVNSINHRQTKEVEIKIGTKAIAKKGYHSFEVGEEIEFIGMVENTSYSMDVYKFSNKEGLSQNLKKEEFELKLQY